MSRIVGTPDVSRPRDAVKDTFSREIFFQQVSERCTFLSPSICCVHEYTFRLRSSCVEDRAREDSSCSPKLHATKMFISMKLVG